MRPGSNRYGIDHSSCSARELSATTRPQGDGGLKLVSAPNGPVDAGQDRPKSKVSPARPHEQSVAAHFVAFQPVEKTQSEQAFLELSRLRNQRGNRALGDKANGNLFEADLSRTGMPVRSLDLNRVVE